METAVQIGTLQPDMVITDLVLDRFKEKPDELAACRKKKNGTRIALISQIEAPKISAYL